MAKRRNVGNITKQAEVNRTETATEAATFSLSLAHPTASSGAYIPATETLKQGSESSSVAESIQAVADEFHLNDKQRMVYNVVAQKFVNQHILKVTDNGSHYGW